MEEGGAGEEVVVRHEWPDGTIDHMEDERHVRRDDPLGGVTYYQHTVRWCDAAGDAPWPVCMVRTSPGPHRERRW